MEKAIIILSVIGSVFLYIWFIYYISLDHHKQTEKENRYMLLERKHELVEEKRELENQLDFLTQIEDYATCSKVQGMLKRLDDAIAYINKHL